MYQIRLVKNTLLPVATWGKMRRALKYAGYLLLVVVVGFAAYTYACTSDPWETKSR